MDEQMQLGRPAGKFGYVLLCLIPILALLYLLDFHVLFKLTVMQAQYVGIFLGLVLAVVFLTVPATKKSRRDKVPLYDLALAVSSLLMAVHVAVVWSGPLYMQQSYTRADVLVFGVIAILFTLEACRRLIGLALPIVAILFIMYARFGYLAPGLFAGREVSWQRLTGYLYLDVNSILGIPLQICAGLLVGFILFSRIFFLSGGAKFFIDFSQAIVGKYRGGPAKIAVVATSLFGTINGSAAANVAVTGVFTIPMMKKAGFKPYTAAAIEAVSGNGGQLMPPVMGVTAFIMAAFMGVPYAHVAIAAAVPAVLYYVSLFVQVDILAAKSNLHGLDSSELPRLRSTLTKGWAFIIPLAVLVYTLFVMHLSPEKSAIYTSAAAFITTLKGVVRRPGVVLAILRETGQGVLSASITCAVAGLVMAVVVSTPLGFAMPLALVEVSGGNIHVLLLLTALLSFVLGMGLPTTPLYILMALLFVPPLIQQNINPMAANLFVFYFGLMSMVTPPVAIAAYVAASVAGSPPMRTGWEASLLSLVAYIAPFVFVFSPGLLLIGSIGEIALVVSATTLGTVILTYGIRRYMLRPLSLVKTALSVLTGAWLLCQAAGWIRVLDWVGVVMAGSVAMAIFVHEWAGRKSSVAEPAV